MSIVCHQEMLALLCTLHVFLCADLYFPGIKYTLGQLCNSTKTQCFQMSKAPSGFVTVEFYYIYYKARNHILSFQESVTKQSLSQTFFAIKESEKKYYEPTERMNWCQRPSQLVFILLPFSIFWNAWWFHYNLFFCLTSCWDAVISWNLWRQNSKAVKTSLPFSSFLWKWKQYTIKYINCRGYVVFGNMSRISKCSRDDSLQV
jgi:hypothetical protein